MLVLKFKSMLLINYNDLFANFKNRELFIFYTQMIKLFVKNIFFLRGGSRTCVFSIRARH